MKVVETNDGSSTIVLEEFGITYHSKHGALQESNHVFIDAGLNYYLQHSPGKDVRIFEMGFGSGLNCLLTYAGTSGLSVNVHYTALDLYPLPGDIWRQLNYCKLAAVESYSDIFTSMHMSNWNNESQLSSRFALSKVIGDIRNFSTRQLYDVVYFDAFSQESNPDQWTAEVFSSIYNSVSDNGLLVTYSSKVIVRRALEQAGFLVQKIPGPYGKREIVRALKKT